MGCWTHEETGKRECKETLNVSGKPREIGSQRGAIAEMSKRLRNHSIKIRERNVGGPAIEGEPGKSSSDMCLVVGDY